MNPRTGRCSNKLLPKEVLWNGVKTLGYPDQKEETVHEIRKGAKREDRDASVPCGC